MFRGSLRRWVRVFAVVFAAFIVGGISLTSYVIVSDGMRNTAMATAENLTSVVNRTARDAATVAESSALSQGLVGDALREASLGTYSRILADHLGDRAHGTADLAVYDPDGSLIWSSGDDSAPTFRPTDEQLAAFEGGKTVRLVIGSPSRLAGLVSAARLGVSVVYSAIPLPGGEVGVLRVGYTATAEEAVIDDLRLPMLILALSAAVIVVAAMDSLVIWVLKLIDDLRRAADSINSGRLDERLPETGENEIGDLARSLNRLIERLQRRAEAQSRFVADASHELATPVAGIRGYTNILREWGGEDETVRVEAIDAIDRESRRMARLSNELLSLLHAEGGLRLRSERFDVRELIRKRLSVTAERYEDKGIDFNMPVDQALYMVGDPDRVDDVLAILLDNAGKYTPPGGSVHVSCMGANERITIRVSDTGAGISAVDLPHIFDRFFRSDAARTVGTGGFGLGLSIAKNVVSSLGGEIVATSVVGEGTTFTVVLPQGHV